LPELVSAFNGSALDVLWATLDSFALLVKCLPGDLWKIDPVDEKMVRSRVFDIRHVFQRPMTLRDWQVFFKYSCHVRVVKQSVGWSVTGCLNLGDDVIFSLSNPPSYGPLIPRLKTLYWDKPTKKYASLLRMLFTPSLVTLSLSTSDCILPSPEVTILTSIGTACPSLRSLCISSGTPFSNFLDTKGEKVLSEAVMCMHSLESLVCPALDEEAFIHLSRLSTLSELSMELQSDFKLDSLLAPPAFGSINTLTLNVSSLSVLTSILESMQFSPS
ncbi:hypothetical protein BU15DRAFT_16847, partial [Melanogaster broomeanus]